MIVRISILIAAVILVGWSIVDRYGYLRVEFDNTRFFNNAAVVLALPSRGELNPHEERIPDGIRNATGNLLPGIHEIYPTTLKKALIDPYVPIDRNPVERYMQLRYGYVEHGDWTEPLERRFVKPRWFVWGAGPSGAAPDIVESVSSDRIRLYRIRSSPYHVSNGLRSGGYLFNDSMGNRIGKMR